MDSHEGTAGFSTDGSACIKRNVLKTSSNATSKFTAQGLDVEFDITKVCQWINQNCYLKVCLQFPDTLLSLSAEVYDAIRSQVQANVFILGDTTYSSCCVDEVAAMHVHADAVVHYGHSCFSRSSMPVYTSLPKLHLDIQSLDGFLHNLNKHSDSRNVCLFYDAAYYHLKDKISDVWFNLYPTSYIAQVDLGKSEDHVLGRCITDINGASLIIEKLADCTCVYLGFRSQTLFNCVISIKAQQWISLNPDNGEISCLDESQWFKRRRYLIEKCKDAINVGILVCKLSGQNTKDIIKRMQELCKVSHKKSYIISVGKPNVAKLANFPEIDVYVMVACPENDLYNSKDFYKPIVYPYELEVAVNSERPVTHNLQITQFEDLLPNRKGYCAVGEVKENTDMSLITGKIRETKLESSDNNVTDLEKVNWAVETIGQHLLHREWVGLEQKLGETEVKGVESGRSGLPISYENEPK